MQQRLVYVYCGSFLDPDKDREGNPSGEEGNFTTLKLRRETHSTCHTRSSKTESSFSRMRKRHGFSHHCSQHSTGGPGQSNWARKTEKFSLFTNDMTLYVENPKDPHTQKPE